MEAQELSTGVFVVPDFFTKKECKDWIAFSEAKGYEEAKINTGRRQIIMKSVRNNERVIYDDLDLAEQLWLRVQPFVPKETEWSNACGLNERFRFYKYQKGQEFKPHKDGSFLRNIHEWSSYTFMVYLNEEMEGGETKFREVMIKPQTGMALIFKHELVHSGCPVKEGLKYVLRTDVMYRRKQNT